MGGFGGAFDAWKHKKRLATGTLRWHQLAKFGGQAHATYLHDMHAHFPIQTWELPPRNFWYLLGADWAPMRLCPGLPGLSSERGVIPTTMNQFWRQVDGGVYPLPYKTHGYHASCLHSRVHNIWIKQSHCPDRQSPFTRTTVYPTAIPVYGYTNTRSDASVWPSPLAGMTRRTLGALVLPSTKCLPDISLPRSSLTGCDTLPWYIFGGASHN